MESDKSASTPAQLPELSPRNEEGDELDAEAPDPSDDEELDAPDPSDEDSQQSESLVSGDSDSEVPDSPDSEAPAPTENQELLEKLDLVSDEEDLSSDDTEDEDYLQKFDQGVRQQFLADYHPEARVHNFEEVIAMSTIVRGANGRIVDALHRTLPFLTKYERTRVLGQRAAQLEAGAQAFVPVPSGVIRGSIIAELELVAKKLPFIIRRPLPSRGSEYWRVSDLEILQV